jgi:sigma-E factor negative regulatory protein RseB
MSSSSQRRRFWRVFPVLALAAICGASDIQAQGVVSSTPAGLVAQEALARLTLIHEASQQQSFTGTVVFSAAGAMSSSRISNYCEGNDRFEQIDSLDGPPRQVLRHNDVVHTVWPEDRVVLTERWKHHSTFPALLTGLDSQMLSHYGVLEKGQERVAGHVANVIQLKPKDGYRYGYLLWSDSKSGLLLRADVLGPRNELLESSAFSDVAIGVKPQPQLVLGAIKKLNSYRSIKSQLNTSKLESHGWVMRSVVPGFKELSCFTRPLNPSANPTDTPTQAIQAVYSDGITHVSLFIESFDVKRHSPSLPSAFGATHTLSRRHADWWITAVGGVPTATLQAFAEGLQRK